MKAGEERMRILKMLEEKKITAEEAAELLASLEAGQEGEGAAPKTKPRWLRIRVRSQDGDRVELNLPLSMVRAAKHFVSELKVQGMTIPVEELEALIDQALETETRIIEVVSADGDHVEIYVD